LNKEELKEYRFLGKEIDLLEEEIKQIRASILASPNFDGMPKGNNISDLTGNTAIKIADLEIKLQAVIDKMINTRGQIERSIETLPADERLLMRYRYIEGMSWEETAVAMHYSWQHTHRIHSRVLQKMRVYEST